MRELLGKARGLWALGFGVVVCWVFSHVVEAALGVSGTTPDAALRFCAPSSSHLLGCDAVGRDLLARLLRAGVLSVGVALSAAGVSLSLGTALGLFLGRSGGLVASGAARIVDAVVAVPSLPVVLVVVLGLQARGVSGALSLVVVFGLLGAAPFSRLVQAQARVVWGSGFVEAARGLGVSEGRIALRHVIPHCAPVIAATLAVEVAGNLLAESALGFLGIGVASSVASWGTMVDGALAHVATHPRVVLWPGLMVFAAVALSLSGAPRARAEERAR